MTDSSANVRPVVFSDLLGRDHSGKMVVDHKKQCGQHLTPITVADFMGGLISKNNKETIRILDPGIGAGVLTKKWTGDFIFENEWQSFRTQKDRTLELMTPSHDCSPGRYKVAVKVVDIFGNDTIKTLR